MRRTDRDTWLHKETPHRHASRHERTHSRYRHTHIITHILSLRHRHTTNLHHTSLSLYQTFTLSHLPHSRSRSLTQTQTHPHFVHPLTVLKLSHTHTLTHSPIFLSPPAIESHTLTYCNAEASTDNFELFQVFVKHELVIRQ